MTPVVQSGFHGLKSRAPTRTSDPRGSRTTVERKSSCAEASRRRRCAAVPRPSLGPPEMTTRVGSPAVWESMTRMARISGTLYRVVYNYGYCCVPARIRPGIDRQDTPSVQFPGVIAGVIAPMPSHVAGTKQPVRAKTDHAGTSLRKAFFEIRELIVHGRLSPGSWIVEADLARHLSMSRTPVRSALPWLRREGYEIAHKK